MNTNISLKLPTHRAYLALALPLTISTITTPLLGGSGHGNYRSFEQPGLFGRRCRRYAYFQNISVLCQEIFLTFEQLKHT